LNRFCSAFDVNVVQFMWLALNSSYSDRIPSEKCA